MWCVEDLFVPMWWKRKKDPVTEKLWQNDSTSWSNELISKDNEIIFQNDKLFQNYVISQNNEKLPQNKFFPNKSFWKKETFKKKKKKMTFVSQSLLVWVTILRKFLVISIKFLIIMTDGIFSSYFNFLFFEGWKWSSIAFCWFGLFTPYDHFKWNSEAQSRSDFSSYVLKCFKNRTLTE